MMRRFALNGTVTVVLLAALSACGAWPGSPEATLVTPTVVVNSTPMQMMVMNGKGALNLDIALGGVEELPAAYRTLAAEEKVADWYEDIDYIEFTVTVEKLKDPIVQKITKAQFINKRAVLQVNNLPPGHVKIHASAIGKKGEKIVEADGEGDVESNKLVTIKLLCAPKIDPGQGHIRVEMDCWIECACAEEPKPSPSAFVPDPLAIVTFRSYGDPHEEGGNGIKFDNYVRGTFLAIQTLTNDLWIEKNHDLAVDGQWAGRPVNNAFGVKTNGDVFLYYLYGSRAFLNGKAVTIADKSTQTLPGGAVLSRNGSTYSIVTPQKDEINIIDKGCYLNLDGKVGGERVVHEVRGSLGTYNNQAGTAKEALLMRNGATAPDLKTFLLDWAVRGDENLFPFEVPFIPAGYKPATGSDKTSETPAPTPTPKPTSTPAPTPKPTSTPWNNGAFTGSVK